MDYVGHKVGKDSIATQEEKKIRDEPIPKTKRELRSFMGLANYYRAYIPNFSDKCLDLTNLTKREHLISCPGKRFTQNSLKV